jgi:hypothetical protein
LPGGVPTDSYEINTGPQLRLPIGLIETQSPYFYRPSPNLKSTNIPAEYFALPVPVVKRNEKYLPLLAERRIRLAQEKGIEEVNVVVFTFPGNEAAWLFVLNESNSGELNALEKIRVMRDTVLPHGFASYRQLCAAIAIPPRQESITLARQIEQLGDPESAYLNRYDFSFKQLEVLLRHREKDVHRLCRMGNLLSLRPIEFTRIAEDLLVIGKRRNQRVADLFTAWEVEEILARGDWNRQQKIAAIRERIGSNLSPLVTGLNRALAEINHRLPAGLSLAWDKRLESDEFQIKISFLGDEDATTRLAELQRELAQLPLQKIQKILRGD